MGISTPLHGAQVLQGKMCVDPGSPRILIIHSFVLRMALNSSASSQGVESFHQNLVCGPRERLACKNKEKSKLTRPGGVKAGMISRLGGEAATDSGFGQKSFHLKELCKPRTLGNS